MNSWNSVLFLINLIVIVTSSQRNADKLNFVINTWSGSFSDATKEAHQLLQSGANAVGAIEGGCKICEQNQCDTSVGYGNHPDSRGFTSLDALIMNGDNFDVGSIAYVRKYRDAISIARKVMEYTSHTLLVGDGAEEFAEMMNFKQISASTQQSFDIFKEWRNNNCQPNYYVNIEEATYSCGPYENTTSSQLFHQSQMINISKNMNNPHNMINKDNHDTIGMVAKDIFGSMACGTSTNGANHKIAGRVGDSPIVGSGCYVNSKVGGAAATGDGDIMMRFLPSFYAVTLMEIGLKPSEACQKSIDMIVNHIPDFSGGVVCVSNDGQHGGAAHNMGFSYSYMDNLSDQVQVISVA
eukprot:gene10882-14604_t